MSDDNYSWLDEYSFDPRSGAQPDAGVPSRPTPAADESTRPVGLGGHSYITPEVAAQKAGLPAPPAPKPAKPVRPASAVPPGPPPPSAELPAFIPPPPPKPRRGVLGWISLVFRVRLWLTLAVIAIGAPIMLFVLSGTKDIDRLQVGDCFDLRGPGSNRVDVAVCDEPHQAQVVALVDGPFAAAPRACRAATPADLIARIEQRDPEATIAAFRGVPQHRCYALSPNRGLVGSLVD